MAYEKIHGSGYTHGHDQKDWAAAKSDLLAASLENKTYSELEFPVIADLSTDAIDPAHGVQAFAMTLKSRSEVPALRLNFGIEDNPIGRKFGHDVSFNRIRNRYSRLLVFEIRAE